MNSAALPLLPAVDLCPMLSIDEAAPSQQAFHVATTLLQVGEPIQAHAQDDLQYVLMNGLGAISGGAYGTSGATVISTTGLSAGQYMLIGRDHSGQVIGRVRIVLQ